MIKPMKRAGTMMPSNCRNSTGNLAMTMAALQLRIGYFSVGYFDVGKAQTCHIWPLLPSLETWLKDESLWFLSVLTSSRGQLSSEGEEN